ncbi:MAG: hypothetical protein K2P51_01325 [Rhabdochlamydiaceae bacterium]|nr:hypothetical protein [Rhabdochlamydiaceae bacterium]
MKTNVSSSPMTTLPISFSSPQLPSALSLQQYFQSTPEIQPVLAAAHEGKIISSDLRHLQYGWGYLTTYLQAIVQTVHAICVKVLQYLAQSVGAENLAKRCKIHCFHLEKDQKNLQIFQKYGSKFLFPTLNTHRRDTEDLYLIPAQPHLDQPNSPFISFHFYHPKGICRGIGDLFFFLYLKAQNQFKSSENLILAVAKVFERGAPREAALLQSMKIKDVNEALKIKPRFVAAFEQPQKDLLQLSKYLFTLPQGEYAVTAFFAGHRLNFIRSINSRRYLIDPTYGVFSFSDETELATYLKEELPKPENLKPGMKQVWIEQLGMDKKIPSR